MLKTYYGIEIYLKLNKPFLLIGEIGSGKTKLI